MEFLKDYSQLINVTLLIAVLGLIIRLWSKFNSLQKKTIENKESEISNLNSTISLLKQQLEKANEGTIFDFNAKLDEFKKFYDENAKLEASKWLKNSEATLIEVSKKDLEKEYQTINEEIKKRVKLFENIQLSTNGTFIPVESVEGKFRVLGSNHDKSKDDTYIGYLTLQVNKHGRIDAKWVIAGQQLHQGSGFYKDNILVINFTYKGEDTGNTYRGIAVYRLLSENILTGFWSEEIGPDNSLGFEECRRLEKVELDQLKENQYSH